MYARSPAPRRPRERAVVADVAAELRQRDEDLRAVGDEAPSPLRAGARARQQFLCRHPDEPERLLTGQHGVRIRSVDTHVLVPVKRLDGAKSRLAESLDAGERADLVHELLALVLAVVKEAEVGPVTIVSAEPLEVYDVPLRRPWTGLERRPRGGGRGARVGAAGRDRGCGPALAPARRGRGADHGDARVRHRDRSRRATAARTPYRSGLPAGPTHFGERLGSVHARPAGRGRRRSRPGSPRARLRRRHAGGPRAMGGADARLQGLRGAVRPAGAARLRRPRRGARPRHRRRLRPLPALAPHTAATRPRRCPGSARSAQRTSRACSARAC